MFRHKDVEFCAMGALGLYLLARFHWADETIDFTSNHSWFDVKLLIEAGSKTPTILITDSTYRNAMVKVFKDNRIIF